MSDPVSVDTLDQQIATTLQNYRKNFLGNALKTRNGFLAKMMANGKVRKEDGGDPISREVILKPSQNGKFIKGLETLSSIESDAVREATYPWAEYTDRVVVSKRNLLLNKGSKFQKQNLARALIAQVETSAKNATGAALWIKSSDPVQAAKQTTTLTEIVSVASGNIVGGLNPATYPLWENQRLIAEGAISASGVVDGTKYLDGMEALYNTIVGKSDKDPDLIVCGPKAYTAYARACEQLKRFDPKATVEADIGFAGYRFNRSIIVLDPNSPDWEIRMLNTEDFELIFHPDAYFELDSSLKEFEGYSGKYMNLYTMYALVCNNRKSHGVLVLNSAYSITGAAVDDGGADYVAGDQLTIAGASGDTPAILSVSSVDGSGVIMGIVIVQAGSFASNIAGNVSATGGTGTGAVIAITTD
jgi:hypothetical protein